MTPKEKAKDLFYKMQLDWDCDSCHNYWAKECALIAVDEILQEYWLHYTKRREYYKEVKQEIEKL